jgi:hypothetical protein
MGPIMNATPTHGPLASSLSTTPGGGRRLAAVLALWLGAAVLFTRTGAVALLPPIVPVIVLSILASWIALYRCSARLRETLASIDLRAFVLLHVVRVPVGALLLWELSRGHLPAIFAERAGTGDVIAGALAVGVALAVPFATRPRRWLATAWSALGLADILLALGSANYALLVLRDPRMLEALSTTHYQLLPTFLVPLVILGHLYVLVRLRDARRG